MSDDLVKQKSVYRFFIKYILCLESYLITTLGARPFSATT